MASHYGVSVGTGFSYKYCTLTYMAQTTNVTGFERTRLPRTQQEDTLFTITR